MITIYITNAWNKINLVFKCHASFFFLLFLFLSIIAEEEIRGHQESLT